MPLLCELDINGEIRRISNQELSLEAAWFAELSDAPTIKYASSAIYGGYFAPTFGGWSCLHETFANVWPPPTTIHARFYYSGEDNPDGEPILLFDCAGHNVGIDDTVHFDAKPNEYTAEIAATTITGTLNAVFTSYCAASYLNLTLNTELARETSPSVSYTLSSSSKAISVLSDIAKFHSHIFYIRNGTLYLIDCLVGGGDVHTPTEFDFLPMKYNGINDVRKFKCGTSDYVTGSYPYGKEESISPVCASSGANSVAALTNIKALYGKRAAMRMPINAMSMSIKPWDTIAWSETRTGYGMNESMFVQGINYDFNDYLVTFDLVGLA